MVEEQVTENAGTSGAQSKSQKFALGLIYAALGVILLMSFIPFIEKIGIIRFLLGIAILDVIVLVHELGHLIAARRAGIPVQIFSIGIGPAVLKRTMLGIEWRLSLLPLGGYVRSESSDLSIYTPGQMARYAWGGPFASFVLAFVAIFAAGIVGRPGIAEPLTIQDVRIKAATEAGLLRGDVIERIGNLDLTVNVSENAMKLPATLKGLKTVPVVISRSGSRQTLSVPVSTIDGRAALGIQWVSKQNVLTPLESAMEAGVSLVQFATLPIMIPYSFLSNPKEAAEGVGGPGAVISLASEGAGNDLGLLLYVVGFLSGIIGGFNLVPIVPLDGGHLTNSLIRFLLRKSPQGTMQKVLNGYTAFGFLCFLALIVVAFGNDIRK